MLEDTVVPSTSRLLGQLPAAQDHGNPGKSSRSGLALLAPLVKLITKPAATLESLVPGLAAQPRADETPTLPPEDRKALLYMRMKIATAYNEWHRAATELDILEDNNAWKHEDESEEYNFRLIQSRLRELDEVRISGNVKRLLFVIRTALTRGLGGMGDIRLYRHSHVGTKKLIERYIDSVQQSLNDLLRLTAEQDAFEHERLLQQMLITRQSFGRSALLLSGGGTFGMNHIGVIKVLWEANLLPRIVSGASAGSIVCAALCTKTDEEIPALLDEFAYGDLAVFTRTKREESLIGKATRFLKHGTIFDISNLITVMKDLLGDITFQEAYNRTRRVLNIPVSSATLFEIPRLLNYVTAPNVIIWSAVATSCSVPLIFEAPQLLTKDPKTDELVPWDPSTRWIDGSVDNDLPITRLAEMFNVNHFIVSQVNPHVVPFMAKEDNNPDAKQSASAFAAGPGWLNTLTDLAKDELLHRMHVLSEMGVFPNYMTKARSILSQQYSGDINIFPEISYTQFPLVLTNPTQEFMAQALLAGERATWPVMSRVRNHCAIELALDNTIKQLRERSIFNQSSDLPRLTSHMSDRSLARYNRAQRLYHTQAALTPLDTDLRMPIRSSSAKPAEARSSTEYLIDPPLQPLEAVAISPVKHTDITSEDSEDSNDQVVHSDSDTAFPSDEPVLNSAPRASAFPSLWPMTRQLFSSPSPSSSLDNPIAHNLDSSLIAPITPTQEEVEPDVLSIVQPQTPAIDHDMLDSALLMKETHHNNASPLPRSPKLSRTSSVEFDLSGTKRMMIRRKRSSNNVSFKSLTANADAGSSNHQGES